MVVGGLGEMDVDDDGLVVYDDLVELTS